MNFIFTIMKLMRVHQYVKNVLIFAPLFFSFGFFTTNLLLETLHVFFAFCLVCSAIYILNDIADAEDDRLHRTKRMRPIASGQINVKLGAGLFVLFACSGIWLLSQINEQVALWSFAYFLMNLVYSLKLKQLPIIDVVIIAVGFVIRLFIGAAVFQESPNEWMVTLVFMLALFVAVAKRRDDVIASEEEGIQTRKVASLYNVKFIDGLLLTLSATILTLYVVYVTGDNFPSLQSNRYAYVTSLFVVIGVSRYLYLAFVTKDTGSPTRLLVKDKFLSISVALWVVTYGLLLYL